VLEFGGGLVALGHQLFEGGHVAIAFDQRGPGTGAFDKAPIQLPDFRRDGRVVRIDQQRVAQVRIGGMACKMDFADQRMRKAVDPVIG